MVASTVIDNVVPAILGDDDDSSDESGGEA
jgi:hypothetical protein